MTNPIFQRLTRYDYHLSFRRDLVVFLVAFAVGLTLAFTNSGYFGFSGLSDVAALALVMAWLWLSFISLICLFRSVWMTTGEVGTSGFRLILITPLSSFHLVAGFFLGALIHSRRVLTISFGVLLPMIAGVFLQEQIFTMDCSGGGGYFSKCPDAALPRGLAGEVWTVVALEIILGLLGTTIFAIVIAVAVSLRLRSRLPSLLITFPVYLAFALPYGMFVFLLTVSPLPLDTFTVSADDLLDVVRTSTLVALIPFALSALFFFAATRWVRRTV
jgi:hypothetical protein